MMPRVAFTVACLLFLITFNPLFAGSQHSQEQALRGLLKHPEVSGQPPRMVVRERPGGQDRRYSSGHNRSRNRHGLRRDKQRASKHSRPRESKHRQIY
jgi:hypothetical protein